jgi:hypothetical protein
MGISEATVAEHLAAGMSVLIEALQEAAPPDGECS